MHDELRDELSDCETLNEMWMALDDRYDLDKPLGTITKKVVVIAFIKNMSKMLKATRTPER